ncbi:MAG: XrtA/PEP-CTERM system histidine kinase PrsK [Betaproteobacteria bacterium]
MTPALVAAASYGAGLIAYLLMAVLIATPARAGGRAWLLLSAASATALWQLSGLAVALRPGPVSVLVHFLADGLMFAAWTAFLLALLPRLQLPGWSVPLTPLSRRAFPLAVLALLWSCILLPVLIPAWRAAPLTANALTAGALVAAAVLGLSLCEQLYRGVAPASRWGIKPLCLGLGASFAFDLFMFSDMLMVREMNIQVWTVRGAIHALTIPLLLLATARNRQWTIDVAVSRQIVFGSAALLLSGLYMLVVAGAGYFVRFFGGEWGGALQVTLLFAGLLGFAMLAVSGTVRARLRVFVSKNFFSYRYDYREEWLRFTNALAQAGRQGGIVTSSIQALADLVESPAGVQWWRGDDGRFVPAGAWNMPLATTTEPSDGPLAGFLERTGWIINVKVFRENRDHYPGLELPQWLQEMPSAWVVIALPAPDRLGGFVVLTEPRAAIDLNWEVLDLLKTAAKQAATVVDQVRLTEALVEAEQFSAFNRMSAFVVHDLKNLVAQLSLMLSNAERHGANPEFQKDMRETIAHVVERMNRLLMQLRSGTTPVDNPAPVDVGAVIASIRDGWTRQGRRVVAEVTPNIQAVAHQDRLERVIGHLVQNGFDAMGHDGVVTIRASLDDGFVVVEVQDQGKGMTAEFIRDELFKPFRSTKTTGMGVGAYESQQYVTELGGRIRVESQPGEGTRFLVDLPARPRPATMPSRHEDAA